MSQRFRAAPIALAAAIVCVGLGGGTVAAVRLARTETSPPAPVATVEPPTTVPTVDGVPIPAYRLVPALRPARLPDGWRLDRATTVLLPGTPEECAQLELDYRRPGSNQGFLYLFQLPATCVDDRPPAGSAPFQAGSARGSMIVDEASKTTRARLRVGDALLEAQSDLPPDGLSGLLAELVPLDTGSSQ